MSASPIYLAHGCNFVLGNSVVIMVVLSRSPAWQRWRGQPRHDGRRASLAREAEVVYVIWVLRRGSGADRGDVDARHRRRQHPTRVARSERQRDANDARHDV